MSLHYLDPRHGKACPGCADCRQDYNYYGLTGGARCAGTGRVGGDAEPSINVFRFDHMGRECWWWVPVGTSELNGRGDFPTEADALFAARCALAGVAECFQTIPEDASPVCYRDVAYPTRDAALCAALDAQRNETLEG